MSNESNNVAVIEQEEDSSDSDVSFNEEFSLFEDFSKLSPFNFEPLDDDEYYKAAEDSEVKAKRPRLNNLNWCDCGGCAMMKTEIECVCCCELNGISEEKFEGMKYFKFKLSFYFLNSNVFTSKLRKTKT